MPRIDYQGAFALLAVELAAPGRTSWGQRDLLGLLARVQAESVVEDDHHQQYLDRFSDELQQAFRTATYTPPEAARPLPDADPRTTTAMEGPASPSIGPRGHEGDTPCPERAPRMPPKTPMSAPRRTASLART